MLLIRHSQLLLADVVANHDEIELKNEMLIDQFGNFLLKLVLPRLFQCEFGEALDSIVGPSSITPSRCLIRRVRLLGVLVERI